MMEQTDFFSGKNGDRIFFRHFPADSEKARLILAHGLGEHSGRYLHVIRMLRALGISVWSPDHRGHGQSDGRRGHVSSFRDYTDDLNTMLEIASTAPGEKPPLFLLGHSLGGLMVLYFAVQQPGRVDGVIASSPALGVQAEIPAAKKFLGRVMSAIWPSLLMANELEVGKISHDPAVVAAYQGDPLVHDRVSARWFTEFMAAMEYVRGNAHRLTEPILLQVAGEDHLVDAGASRGFFDDLPPGDKKLIVYDELYHEIYNEPAQRAKPVLDDLSQWLQARIRSGK